MADRTNENPFCEQPVLSKHICERMREINALEDDGHWYPSDEFPCGPGGNAELIGVCEHHSGGLLYYFCDPFLKRVYVCNPDQSEPVYAWDVPIAMDIPGYVLQGVIYLDVSTLSMGNAAIPHWTRSICVGSDGYVYVAIFATFRKSPASGLNNNKYVTYVAQISGTGKLVQNFVMSARDAYGFWDDITAQDWRSRTGAVTVYQDKLVFAHDRLATRWAVKDEQGYYIYSKEEYNSRILVKNTTSGFLVSQWVTPQYDWPSSAKDLYSAVFIRANAHGVFYISARRVVYSGPYHDAERWWYALVGRKWDQTEICIKENERWYEDVAYSGTSQVFLFPAAHFDVGPVSKRGFLLTDSYLIVPVYLVERRSTYSYREYPYHIAYTVELEELSEDAIDEGEIPDVLVEPHAEVSCIPNAPGHTFKGMVYMQDGTTLRTYRLYEATPWYAYRVHPYPSITALGIYPEDNALVGVHAESVATTLYELRDALLNLLELRDYYRPMGRTVGQRPYAIGYTIPPDALELLTAVKMYSENDYGLGTNLQNGWRRLNVDGSLIRDIDIGEVYEAIQGLKGEIEQVSVSRFSRSFLANTDLLP